MQALQIASVLTLVAVGGMAARAPSSRRDGIYTDTQAEQGRAVYDDLCVLCHGPMRAIVPEVAALLADHTFRNRWQGRSLGELFELIRDTMPQDDPGTLSPEQTADLVAYILNGNRQPAGDVTLTADVAQLSLIPFER